MRIDRCALLALLALPLPAAPAQDAVPTFQVAVGEGTYTLLGRDPARGGKTTIPTVLVPITLTFDTKQGGGKTFVMDAGAHVPRLLRSPVFADFEFPVGGKTQYIDAFLRATFPGAAKWHTRLGMPKVRPLEIAVPAGSGYVLTSKASGRTVAVVDLEWLQAQLGPHLQEADGKLVVAVTLNTTFYADGDATICCAWGTHGVDSASGTSFVLGSILHEAPAVVTDADLQPLTQQLAQLAKDPRNDPLAPHRRRRGDDAGANNTVPGWMRPDDRGGCGGTGVASAYFLLEPTDTNPKNHFPTSPAYVARAGKETYQLHNVALLPWYTGTAGDLGSVYSFPDAQLFPAPAEPCPARGRRGGGGRSGTPEAEQETVTPVPASDAANGHLLIGYWAGYGSARSTFPLREISPQWDVILIAFCTVDDDGPEGTMTFHPPEGMEPEVFKADVAYLQGQGKRVILSLGGAGQDFTLDHASSIANFVGSVGAIVEEYGFDGIDIDFESPSLSIAPGDTDFRRPTTPSTVNFIAGLRQLRERFGEGFLITLVPEGTQVPAGYPSYGGQFGSYLPIAYALRDVLFFVDTQSYNTPPLQGLDGEIYEAGTVDYHAAMTELLLHGFDVGGDPAHPFPPLPADKVAVGFLTGAATPAEVSQTMDYLITGTPPAGVTYRLRTPGGYPGMIGAMFWTINGDRRGDYEFSNTVGPQLHGYPAAE